jgi:phosphomannomutase
MEVLSLAKGSLQEMVDKLPETFTIPERRIKASNKFQIIQNIKKDLLEQGIEFDDLDGIKVISQDGWWLLRASNTEEYLVLRAESFSRDLLDDLLNQGLLLLQKHTPAAR